MATYNNITRVCILVIIIYLSFDFLFGTNYSHLHASIRATSLINMSTYFKKRAGPGRSRERPSPLREGV